jgi:uncharacterized protein DUF2804
MRTPWRGPGPGRPALPLPLPPERMPLLRGGRPLKRWTWVGAFGPEVMLCAAVARIGPVPVSWWAVLDRSSGRFEERSLRRGLAVTPEHVRVPGVLDLEVSGGSAIEVVSPHGSQYAWTRKRGGVRVRGMAGGRPVDALGLVDESAGYHARQTAWRWSAGVGVLESGEPVAWNLVDGLHDAASASERTVWIAGAPREVGPVAFGAEPLAAGTPPDLAAVAFAEGGALRFTAEATRARRENLLLIASDYEQPFGTFAGELPGAGPLRAGWGVMERHDVRW